MKGAEETMKSVNGLGVLVPAALIALLSLHMPAHADGGMTLSGTLIAPPPCVISEGERIEVNFGERVGINKVDGVNYRQGLNYQITCEDTGSNGWALSLRLAGTAASFDANALQTDKTDMGIRIYQNNQPFTPNTAVNITLATPPTLEAVPVKRAGSELTEGAFEALATLQADYQ